MTTLRKGASVTINGLVGAAELNGFTGVVHEPAADDNEESHLVVHVAMPNSEMSVFRVKQKNARLVATHPVYSSEKGRLIQIDKLFPVLRTGVLQSGTPTLAVTYTQTCIIKCI